MLAVSIYHLNGNSMDLTNRDLRVIVTDSMAGEPTDYEISTIEVDSAVMVRLFNDESDKESVKVGDVVQFRYFSMLDHHRVVSNDPVKKVMVTKGDNSDSYESVDYSNVRGVVVGTNHLLGQAITFMKSYWPSFIVVIIGLFVIDWYLRTRTEDKE